jgi:hypothetical protein
MSSKKTSTNLWRNGAKVEFIALRKVDGAPVRPKAITLNWN